MTTSELVGAKVIAGVAVGAVETIIERRYDGERLRSDDE
jgi:hypothetical protein